jgi:ribonucleases P/MRP protein subunit RPP40
VTHIERLFVLDLPTLEERRSRGDMIQMFKIKNEIDRVKLHNPIQFSTSSPTRSHKAKIRRQIVKKGGLLRHNLSTNRVTVRWNQLTQAMVNLSNVNAFKNGYDKLVESGCLRS